MIKNNTPAKNTAPITLPICEMSTSPNSFKTSATILITHYQRLLNEITPDFVHIMADGKIIKTGNKELAIELEKSGYEFIDKNNKYKQIIK